jgi:hypothetical protein
MDYFVRANSLFFAGKRACHSSDLMMNLRLNFVHRLEKKIGKELALEWGFGPIFDIRWRELHNGARCIPRLSHFGSNQR